MSVVFTRVPFRHQSRRVFAARQFQKGLLQSRPAHIDSFHFDPLLMQHFQNFRHRVIFFFESLHVGRVNSASIQSK